jgi:glycosyltransferase involved in cell wall biosynthesis
VSEHSVSVVVVVRDGARYLAEALTSALGQTAPPAEVIVVDDGSVDGSRQVAESFGSPVRVLAQAPLGIAIARNRGVADAGGELVAFLDADDIWPPGALACRLRGFEADPPPDVVWGWVRQFRSADLEPALAAQMRCPSGRYPAHLPGGALISRAVFTRVGPFAGDLRMGEFVDWVARARDLGIREATVPEVVLHRRVHADNHTRRHREDLADLTVALRRTLHRRRGR